MHSNIVDGDFNATGVNGNDRMSPSARLDPAVAGDWVGPAAFGEIRFTFR